jgi:hypothetical protein
MKPTVQRRIPLLVRHQAGPSEPTGRFKLGRHQRRAGLGVWAVTTSAADRVAIKAWKQAVPFDHEKAAKFVEGLTALVGLWAPVIPDGAVLTIPPQGASAPGPYAADFLVKLVADKLGLPFVPMLARSDHVGSNWGGYHFGRPVGTSGAVVM